MAVENQIAHFQVHAMLEDKSPIGQSCWDSILNEIDCLQTRARLQAPNTNLERGVTRRRQAVMRHRKQFFDGRLSVESLGSLTGRCIMHVYLFAAIPERDFVVLQRNQVVDVIDFGSMFEVHRAVAVGSPHLHEIVSV